MNFLRWFETFISPAEPCTTVSQRSSTTQTHSPTPDAKTHETGLDQCSAKLNSPQSLNDHVVAGSEQHKSEDDADKPATEPKRVQSPNVQLVEREHIARNDFDRRIANYNPNRHDKTAKIVLAGDVVPLFRVTDYIQSCSVPDAQKHLFIQESKKVVMMAMLSDVGRDILVASLQGFEEEMKYYQAVNMTKKDVEEQSRDFLEFSLMTFSSRRTMKFVKERLGGTSERKVAIRNFFYSQLHHVKGSDFGRNFARCFSLKRTEREVCRALNAEMISRIIEYNSLWKFQKSRDSELSTRDAKLASKELKSRGTIETPQCTLSFMNCFGISMMPCGLLASCNSGEIRTASSFFTDEPSNQSTLSVAMDELTIDTSHALSVVEPFTRTSSTTISPYSDQELLTIAKPISQKYKSVTKEDPVGKEAEKGDELRRKRILERDEMEKGDVNENETGSESENGNGNENDSRDEDGDESVIKVENEIAIKIEDDSEREMKINSNIEEECDDSDSSVDEDLYKAKLELLSQISNELSLLNKKKKKRKKQKKEDEDQSGSKRVKIE